MSYQQPPQQPQQQFQQPPQYQPSSPNGVANYQGRFGYVGPQQFEPLSAWMYFWYGVLFGIPLIGWIFLIIDCFTTKNYNLRSFARSYFCALVIGIIVSVILLATGAIAGLAGSAASGFSASV
jgi:hypothetical protein